MQCAPASYLPDPTPRMRELLRLRQIGLTLPQLLFRTLALGNLKAQVLIGSSQFCRPLCNSHFKLISGSRSRGHQERKNQEYKVIKDTRHAGDFGIEDIAADERGEHSGENARSGATVPKCDRDCS